MWLPQGSFLSPFFYNIWRIGNSNGLWPVLFVVVVHLQMTNLSMKQPVIPTQLLLLAKNSWKKCHNETKRQSPKSIPADFVVHPKQQSSWIGNASGLLQRKSHRTCKQHQIPADLLQHNAHIKDAGRINKTQVQKGAVCSKSHGCKRHWTMSSVPAVSECDSQCYWSRSLSHNPVTVQPSETWQ